MPASTNIYLKTGLNQIETNTAIVAHLHSVLDYLTYNVKRYKVPVTLIMFYSEENISKPLEESIRLTDVLTTVKLGQSYFSFIFLPFTELTDSYTFIKHVEQERLSNIEHYYYFEELQPNEFNYYNFLNSYLFKLTEKKEADSLGK